MKGLKTALLVSAALNIFLGGMFLGEKFMQPQMPSLIGSPVETVLTQEKRIAYQNRMEQAKQRFRQGRDSYDALHAELMALLESENFDKAAYQRLTEKMLAERSEPLERFLQDVAATVEEMSAAERQAVAQDIHLRYDSYRKQKKCPKKDR